MKNCLTDRKGYVYYRLFNGLFKAVCVAVNIFRGMLTNNHSLVAGKNGMTLGIIEIYF